jgi:predicted MFS family arabinose efflux permease
MVFGIVKAQTWGWGSTRVVAVLAAGLALLALFLAIESRSKAPLMRLSIFRVRSLAVADSVMLLVASGLFGMFFFVSLYVQDILGYGALHAGLAFLPVTGGIMLGAGLSQKLVATLGARTVAVVGVLVATAGMVLLTGLPEHGGYAANLLPGLLPLSIGIGLTFVPITLLGTGGVTESDAGLASGLFNTAQQVGGALGLAILSTLAADHTSSLLRGLGGAATPGRVVAATLSGYHVAFVAAALMLGAGALLMGVAVRRRHLQGLNLEASPVPAGV